MGEIFRKGQIVPKRLGFVITHKKTQHNVTFGCDVEVTGRVVKAISEPSPSVMMCNTHKGRKRKNGTIQRGNYGFVNIIVDCNNMPIGGAFTVKC